MKVPTKEEGKSQGRQPGAFPCSSLDEGPYGKAGNDICNQTDPVPFASSMKAPRKREGIHRSRHGRPSGYPSLNENPSKKEGKRPGAAASAVDYAPLNESPSQKEGKCLLTGTLMTHKRRASMKAPPIRKGNGRALRCRGAAGLASMKALPRRKGNPREYRRPGANHPSLNESPTQKEGKFALGVEAVIGLLAASMKAPPRRKGNSR